ncbi:hypothetical protein K7432_005454 [Basidiobolus ranarum]|uniref:GH18 domain-containing protein n=1 Tax=Basidiobolus ranarum TaxID=34480 RepID=A0ABR2WWG1_9FUNG
MKSTYLCASILLLFNSTIQARPVGSDGKIVVAYWADWTGFSPNSVDFSKITHVNYAFAIPQASGAVTAPSALGSLVTAAHSANTQVLLSLGGWGGSATFSSIVASPGSRQTFANSIKSIMDQYKLDGIDLDWEYPGVQGACGNQISPQDTANFLEFLKLLRSTVGNKLITAATATTPFAGADGKPSSDVREFSEIFDWINLMTYDLNGIWGLVTGPNAPLVKGSGGAATSVVDGVQSWMKAGVPNSKLTIGTAFYGHSMYAINSMATNQPHEQFVAVQGGSNEHNCAGGGFSKSIDWIKIRQYLSNPTTANSPWIRQYDNITQTPWLYNPGTKQYISYDDPQSLARKVQYAGCMNLKGVMLWEISQDNGELLPVLDKIASAQGGQNCEH